MGASTHFSGRGGWASRWWTGTFGGRVDRLVMLEQPGMADQRAVGGGHGQEEARVSVEEPALQHVAPDEPPTRSEDDRGGVPATAFVELPFESLSHLSLQHRVDAIGTDARTAEKA